MLRSVARTYTTAPPETERERPAVDSSSTSVHLPSWYEAERQTTTHRHHYSGARGRVWRWMAQAKDLDDETLVSRAVSYYELRDMEI